MPERDGGATMSRRAQAVAGGASGGPLGPERSEGRCGATPERDGGSAMSGRDPDMDFRIIGVSKRLGGRRILERFSLTVESGATAVLGANGSGKTTLLRIAAGVLDPDEGRVLLAGRPLARARAQLGYVPEAADPPLHLTGGELLALVASLRRAPPIDRALAERLGVEALAGQRIGSMSLGQRRRACLAAALVGSPWLLVLDEPTNGLDPDGTQMLLGVLRDHIAGGGGVLLATHDLGFADGLSARRIVLSTGPGSARSSPEPRRD
jgi:ABC-type multidrug transport system ATPase subunit